MSAGFEAKAVFRKIWNGPFYVGPLTQPASVGDVLLKVLETFWRSVIALVSVSAIVIIGALAWEVVEPLLFPPIEKSIVADARYDDGSQPLPPVIDIYPKDSPAQYIKKQKAYADYRCSPEFPILIEFTNRSNKKIRHIGFAVEAYAPGYSDDRASVNWMNSYAILFPLSTQKACWNIPVKEGEDAANLTYRVKILSAAT